MISSSLPAVLIDTLARVHTTCAAQRIPCYLVGGLLRDQRLDRPFAYLNVDLAVAAGAVELARRLAAVLRGAFVVLDERAGVARVVVTTGDQRVELDISEFRAPTLDGDLRLRDFTINAMAVRLEDWLQEPAAPQPLIDPLDGQGDLKRRRLRPCFPGTFEDDPVRILRGFRFAAQLGWAIDDSLTRLMASSVPKLAQVSGERVRDELFAIFETDRAGEAVASLDALGALDVLIPELSVGRGMAQGGYHHLDVLGHELETVHQADRILRDCAEFTAPLRDALLAYCREEPIERRSRRSLIKLGGLLHDIGKPAKRQLHDDGEIWFIGHEHAGAELAAPIVERLRLSNREAHVVVQLVQHHLRPGFLSREPQLTRKAIYRFYKELGDNGPACVLTWWCDRMATRGPQSNLAQLDQQRARTEELLEAYFFKAEEVVKPPRLLDGRQLMAAFHLTPGPLIGELLSAIEEAQAEGRLRSSDEAVAFAREHLKARHPPA